MRFPQLKAELIAHLAKPCAVVGFQPQDHPLAFELAGRPELPRLTDAQQFSQAGVGLGGGYWPNPSAIVAFRAF